jgi:membrane protein DedA with SNARE-associated domain
MTGVEQYLSLADPLVHDYGYPAVFLVLFLESFGAPLPGESLVVASALLASHGDLHIAPLLAVVWLAAVLGDNVGYAIGLFGGRRLVLRYGARIGITEPRLKKVESFFRRYGAEVVLVARFFVPLRQLNGLTAGTVAMPWRRFLVYNALGAGLWSAVWCYGVYLVGQDIAVVLPWLHGLVYAIVLAVVLAAAALLIVRYFKARGRPRNG